MTPESSSSCPSCTTLRADLTHLREQLEEAMNHKILTAGDSDNPIRALNTHGKTGSEATSADTSGPANMEAVAKNVGAIRQESERPAVRTVNEVTLREQLEGTKKLIVAYEAKVQELEATVTALRQQEANFQKAMTQAAREIRSLEKRIAESHQTVSALRETLNGLLEAYGPSRQYNPPDQQLWEAAEAVLQGREQAQECEGDCNPYVAACGARFCTMEDMRAHRCPEGREKG